MTIIFEFILQALIEIVIFVVWIIVSFVFVLTGDIVLWTITFGKHDPTWPRYRERSNIGLQIFTEFVFWIGIGTWVIIAIIIHQVKQYKYNISLEEDARKSVRSPFSLGLGQGTIIMCIPNHIKPFWKSFEAEIGHDESSRFYESFHFDDNETNANALGDLVLKGRKRATAGLLWDNEINNKSIPNVGDLSVVTNWQQEPLCIIETTQVEIVPYEDVGEAFAAVEGEGNGSLRHWREAHWLYFSRECRRLGKAPNLRMPIICECFKVVYP